MHAVLTRDKISLMTVVDEATTELSLLSLSRHVFDMKHPIETYPNLCSQGITDCYGILNTNFRKYHR